MSEEDDYGLSPEKEVKTIAAPPINYLPEGPKNYKPKIGVIGTGESVIFTSRPTRNVVGMLSPYITVPNLKLRRSEINFFLMLLLSILMRKF